MVAIACLLFAFVYAPFDIGSVALLAVAPVALILLDPAIRCSLPVAALCGLAFGWIASLAIVGPWMYQAAAEYFGKPAWFAATFTIAINGIYVAAFYAPLFALVRLLARAAAVPAVIGTACLWTAFEYLRATLAGNGWALLGQGLDELPVLREAAAVGGVWLLSLGCALCGAGIGVASQRGIAPRQRRLAIDLAVAGPILLLICGYASRPSPAARAILPLRVAAVQAQIAGTELWDPARRVEHFHSHLELTETLRPGRVDLVVWPENAIPFLLDADASARQRLSALAQRLEAAIVVGAGRSEAGSDGTARFFNSAYLFAADGSAPTTYDKMRLLPYIETAAVPAADAEAGTDYSAGTAPVLFEVADWKIAPLICLEAIDPRPVRAAAKAGADLILNISNDAWFAGGGGPEQHFAMSALRAPESRRPMVRVANGGVSGAITSRGNDIGPRIRRSRGVEIYEVQPGSVGLTPYHRFGDWVALLCAVIAAWSCLRAWRSPRPSA